MFKSNTEKAQERKWEEVLFNKVAQELEQGIKHNATWAKALANADTNNIVEGLYIKYRVQSLQDDITLEEEARKRDEQTKELYRREKVKEVERKENSEKVNDFINFIAIFMSWILLLLGIGSLITLGLAEIFDIKENMAGLIGFLVGLPIATYIAWIVEKSSKKNNIKKKQ